MDTIKILNLSNIEIVCDTIKNSMKNIIDKFKNYKIHLN